MSETDLAATYNLVEETDNKQTNEKRVWRVGRAVRTMKQGAVIKRGSKPALEGGDQRRRYL